MNLIYLILFIISALALLAIIARRMRLTLNDIKFQNHLVEEDALKMEDSLPEETDFFESAEAQEPIKGSARNHFVKAEEHFSKKNWPDAEALLITVIQIDPTHVEAHHKLGLLYMQLQDFQNAELFFNKLVNLKKDPVYYSNLGASLYHQQRLVESAEAYENALSMDDKRGERLQSLAQVYYEMGDHDKALEYFERAERRKPRDLELKLLLADYYEKMQRPEDSALMLKKILEIDPYNEEVKGRLEGLNSEA